MAPNATISPETIAPNATDAPCACQPSEYTITFDFAAVCDDKTIDVSVPGIAESICVVDSPIVGTKVTDPIPVTVSSILIAELDQDLQDLKQENFTGVFVNGDQVSYTSYTVEESGNISASDVPRGLQVTVFALNAAGEALVNRFVILYTNNCTDYPVLQEGMQIGWVVFVSTTARVLVDDKSEGFYFKGNTNRLLDIIML